MSCSLHSIQLPKPKAIKVNGIEVPRSEISREAQYFPAQKPIDALQSAARALVIRQLLLAEANRLAIRSTPKSQDGRTETDEEALIRALFEQEVATPEPDEETCRRYYAQNRARFRTATIYQASHILIAADRSDAAAFRAAKEKAMEIAAQLQAHPGRFDDLAASHSDCASAAQGGNLGQLIAGQTTPEFEQALIAMIPGAIGDPVESRYGFHIIRLDRKIEGKELPFEIAKTRIEAYLRDAVERRASAQFIARLVSRARIEGIDLADAADHRVN
jgi:peptidyl-prolyl cis-trans isomerase C